MEIQCFPSKLHSMKHLKLRISQPSFPHDFLYQKCVQFLPPKSDLLRCYLDLVLPVVVLPFRVGTRTGEEI